MKFIIDILIVWIAIFHVNAFVLEAFLWESPRTMQAFGTDLVSARSSKTLALNQGVYNLFLTAGLIWSLLTDDPVRFRFQVFFLGCVIVAAAVAGLTESRRIMVIQGAPAVIALLLVLVH